MINLIEKAESHFLEPMQSAWDARAQKKYMRDVSFSAVSDAFASRNDFYGYMHHHFHNICPTDVREHRSYFKQERRGFGEDAFHAMWFTLLREFQPRQCLEIGVYRGQVISLWALIARICGFPCDTHGISPFTSIGDEVSVYLHDVAYLEDTLSNHRHFGLHEPHLTHQHCSTFAPAAGTWLTSMAIMIMKWRWPIMKFAETTLQMADYS
jgi:hypothetical protein